MILAGVIVAKWWRDDYLAARQGTPHPRPFPGATPANTGAMLVAAAGALMLLALETGGELALGLTAQQSQMTGLFGLYTLVAAFLEELIFRGYLVVENRGRGPLLAGIVGASFGFALLHPFLWEWRGGALHLHGGAKPWFSTAAVFAGSLWFYAVRFFPQNPTRSLLPCVAAHLTKNLGVIVIKSVQGFVAGWW
ncbi:MAG: CPBP family intramembrane metalloprotease [Opitutae bacterium]|nr:CPBP family intramembrane metalloprotease [Opitutae bacterium]